MTSKKVSFRKKDFYILYQLQDDEKVKPLCALLPKIREYIASFDESKYMSFLVKDLNCLKNIIISGIKSVNRKYLKTEIKSYKGEINTHFMMEC